jgi:hypothetical protein
MPNAELDNKPAMPSSAAELSQPVPHAPEARSLQIDPLLSSVFLSAAALVLALTNPINVGFKPHPVETIVAVLAGVLLLGWATLRLRKNNLILFAGWALLIAVVALEIMTQPTRLDIASLAIWPLRIALALLVICSWLFFLQPPRWFQRALIAFVVPTIAALVLVGGPGIVAQLFGGVSTLPLNNNLAPYWLAVNSHGTLYASDLDSSLIWVFDSSGSPQGAIHPGAAPIVPTPGPGILPAELQNELKTAGLAFLNPTTTPLPSNQQIYGVDRPFGFCGMGLDSNDNLYLLDIEDLTGYKILRFDSDGNITARWPTPPGFEPTNNCIVADSEYLYLNGIGSRIYILDHNGKQVGEVTLNVQPFAISAPRSSTTNGGHTLLASGPNDLERIDITANGVTTRTLPPPPTQLQFPILALSNGQLLMTDHQRGELVRVDPESGRGLGTIGEAGVLPGQLGDVGGLAEDASGRIYVADYVNRVIQRFTPDGKVDAVWWVQEPGERGREID